MIERGEPLQALERLFRQNPVVAILGARQVGKTTLAAQYARKWAKPTHVFDLERRQDRARLEDPELGLQDLRGLVVLDEIQRRPDLFPTLQVLADRPRRPARFLVLGSASRDLLRQSSESLAGRIAYHELTGLGLDEVGAERGQRLWLRGGFPRSFLARSHAASAAWRADFVRAFLERDVPQLGISIPSATLEGFWSMLAHYHGQVWNASELERHPKVGASWEGFVLEAIVRHLGARAKRCYFWATHTGAELDLLVERGGRLLGYEIKRTTAPRVTKSMRTALEDLELAQLDVIHAGSETFPLDRRIRAVAAARLLDDVPRHRNG